MTVADRAGIRGAALGLVAGACLVIAGCAGPRARSEPPMASAPVAGGDPHAQIEALDHQIAGELARAHVAPPVTASCAGPACAAAMSQPFATPPPPAGDAACHPAATDACRDTCTLSTSICDDQAKICALASQLAGDDWAASKCASARASCQAAHDRCCGCGL